MNDRQRLEAIISVVCKYLQPDGIPIKDAMSEIISFVDPLPPHQQAEPVAWSLAQRMRELLIACRPSVRNDCNNFDRFVLRKYEGRTPNACDADEQRRLHDLLEYIDGIEAAQPEQQAEPVAWNAGVPPMHPTQKGGETFSVSHLPADDTEGGAV